MPARLKPSLRERITFSDGQDSAQPIAQQRASMLSQADIAVFASSGLGATPEIVIEALANGTIPLVARLPIYEELLDEGNYGLSFEIGDALALSSQLARLIRDHELRRRLAQSTAQLRPRLSWTRVAQDFEVLYAELADRRHLKPAAGEATKRIRQHKLIDVDLHMHTNHSYDCATPVDVLLESAKQVGLGAIAVTDHNEISGAHAAFEQAQGIKVIVAEEIKTQSQGEVIGLFLQEKIPRGMTLAQTIAAIKQQGGLVYVPHPFDRLHSVPDYEHLLEIVEEIDVIEVFNARVAVKEFNEEAMRFAAKYRIVAGAGSDAHVPQGLGSVRIRMRDFDGPQEFLASLRDADIIRKPANLLYVQALKFLQTRGRSRRG
jgi:hypothetical protein